MNMKTVAQATKDLEAVAKQLGASGFDAGRKAYLAKTLITDEEGNVLQPDQYEINVTVEKAAEIPAESFKADADNLTKSIRAAVRAELGDRGGVTVSKAASIVVGGDDTRKDVPRGRVKHMKSAQNAHDFGRWLQAITYGDRAPQAVRYCREKGMHLDFGYFADDNSDRFTKTIHGASEAVNADGGFLVPAEIDNELLWLREQFGVIRQHAQIKPMSSDHKTWNQKIGSHTAYASGEGQTNTVSKMTFRQLSLTARKWRIDGYLTTEVSEDAAIAMGDEAAKDCTEVFALTEDTAGFLGDGTSTYNGIVGLRNAFLNLGTVSNSIGIYDSAAAGTGATYDTITKAGLAQWFAKLPAFADGPNAKIYCSKTFYHSALERLMAESGGNSMIDLATGQNIRMYLGYPVVFCQAIPAALTANVPDAFFGDLSKAMTFGDRRGITFKTTDTGGDAWAADEIAYKATERFDINVHNIGNNTSTAADQKAGPLVALIVG